MKKYISILLFVFVITSCFKDTGNYDYKELHAPSWMKNYSWSPQNIKVRLGSMATFKGSSMFVWDKNPEQRANEVRYEWRFNDKVISEELDFTMPVEEIMEKAGIKDYSGDMGTFGTFSVIEKETGVSYMAKLLLWVYSYYTNYDWFVLSQTGGNTTLSSLRALDVIVDGENVKKYDFEVDAYKKKNNKTIPGKALSMNWSRSKDFGSQGCITVITDQAAYMLNSEDLNHVSDLSNEFLDGAPAGFKPVARVDINPSGSDYPPCTFVANEDGKIYSRVQSKNYLGGKFLTEPYEIDEKGYDITYFGNSRYGGTIPCYDAKNQRLIMACVWREDIPTGVGMNTNSVYRTKLNPVNASSDVAALDRISKKGSEVLHISFSNHGGPTGFGNTSELYTIFFNRADYPDRTFVYDVSIDNRSMRASNAFQFYHNPWEEIPIHLTKEDIILETGNGSSYAYDANYRTLFTYTSRDNRLYYMQRTPYSSARATFHVVNFPDGEGVVGNAFPAKITALNYEYFGCDRIMVGLENGDFYLYELYNCFDTPQLMFKGNTGGKVISFKQLGSRTSSNDNF